MALSPSIALICSSLMALALAVFTHLKLKPPTGQHDNSFLTVGMHETQFGGANSMFVGLPTMLLNPSYMSQIGFLDGNIPLDTLLCPQGVHDRFSLL